MFNVRNLLRKLPKIPRARRLFLFSYLFVDGTAGMAIAPTPGDARAYLKRERVGGRLPVVDVKFREPVDSYRSPGVFRLSHRPPFTTRAAG